MTDRPDAKAGPAAETTGRIVISVDAMGGDLGAAAVVAALVKSASKNPHIAFLLHGDAAELRPLVDKRRALDGRCELRHAERVITMDDKPSHAMRRGEGTSMWSTVEAVRAGEAAAAVSCGNTGALMALSMTRLRRLPGVNRPAIAGLWPSRNPQRFNVILDVGADVRAEAADLLNFALMGASYARNGLGVARPRVGLLNVGTEEHKGRPELRAAWDLLQAAQEAGDYDFVGFVEGGDIPSRRVDVIVCDGFTGNVAIKTGEGTAKMISEFLGDAFRATPLSRIAALLALTSLRRMRKRIDPRRVNGGVFLGLNGTVIKSHGSADATGISAAIKLAFQLAHTGFQKRLESRLATALATTQDARGAGEGNGSNT